MIGTQINDRYRIDSELGQGGMGTVYKGFDTTLEREVAIKMITESRLGTEGRNRLLQEAKAIAQLSHPNIITVFDAGEFEQSPYIVMQYVEGVNLYDEPPKDIEEIVLVMKQVCAALSHAHKHGIIHRDLKPENVILTVNGTVKLMDFGLARSISSRLTSEGTILGTVFYLAPEQAQGKAIDPRSDLYSLGVMLYELATGELPFTASDPLAVVSQHIHAPVVPPRAKKDQIPPALEALILQLMHKDPADRPASAKEVQERLSAPEMLDVTALPKEELSVLDRIVRGRLVGREPELKQARQMWQQAMAGQGQLLLVSGEPGVGKTRLMREVVTQAEVSGGQAYIGESQAEGNAPYAAFAQIIRRALRAHQNNDLELPNLVMAELISIAPELQFDYPSISPNPTLEPESEQRRLFESVFRFVKSLSEQSSLVLVLEDIHWADSGTLSLLKFLTRRCRELPVLILATYREMELDEALPFHQTLLDLNRKNLGTRLKLERLDENKTRELLAVIFDEEITPDFLAGIYRETEGNPFFIEEVCKALIESGQVYFDGEIWQRPPDMAEMQIPQSIKVAVQSRVSKLSEATQETLLNAAVIGREFGFELLQKVTGKEEDDLIEGLEAALKAQLIEEIKESDGERFSFSHALIPTTLRESLSGMRRTRMHRKIAQVMEEVMPNAYQRLAYHWGEGGDLEKGLDYTIKAAERARQTYANEDAIRLYGEALEMLPEDDHRCFDILQARAEVHENAASRKAQLLDSQALLDFAENLDDNLLRCKAHLALAKYYSEENYEESIEHSTIAFDLAEQLKNPVLKGSAVLSKGIIFFRSGKSVESLDSLREALKIFQEFNQYEKMAMCLNEIAIVQSIRGNFTDARDAAEKSLGLSKKVGDKQIEMRGFRMLGNTYFSEGDRTKAQRYYEKSLKMAQDIGYVRGEIANLMNIGLVLRERGLAEEAEPYLLEALEKSDETGLLGVNVISIYHEVFNQTGNYEAGIRRFQIGMEKARQNGYESIRFGYLYGILNCLDSLGQYHQKIKMMDERFFIDVDRMQGPIAKLNFQTWQLQSEFFLTGDGEKLDLMYKVCTQIKDMSEPGLEYGAYLSLAFAKSFQKNPTDWEKALDYINQADLPTLQSMNTNDLQSGYLAITARLYTKLGNYSKALNASTDLIQLVEDHNIYEGREFCYNTHADSLRASGDEEQADKYLKKAYERLMLVAGKTENDEYRRSWLENVPWNREILEEAKARGMVKE